MLVKLLKTFFAGTVAKIIKEALQEKFEEAVLNEKNQKDFATLLNRKVNLPILTEQQEQSLAEGALKIAADFITDKI
tara:strand:- start:704 stop:934 length:231 start_codon:yes stop_codon:yes gene_type:complete